MTDKIKLILNSPRFWMLTLAALSQIAKVYAPSLQELWDILSVWLAGVVAVGSLDSAATKIGSGSVTANIDNVEKVTVTPEPTEPIN